MDTLHHLNPVDNEYVNPHAPPAFTDVGEGLAFLDQQRDEEIEKLHAEVKARMEANADDPRLQNYFVRLDRNTVIQNEEEYVRCQIEGIKLKTVSYSAAKQLLAEADAKKRADDKARKARKAQRKARKRK